jgi:hypothetical protein
MEEYATGGAGWAAEVLCAVSDPARSGRRTMVIGKELRFIVLSID